MADTITVGFVGLGSMGSAMAANVAAAGFRLLAYNRDRAKAEQLARGMAGRGIEIAPSAGAAAGAAGGIVLTMLSDDEALEQVTLGPDGLIDALGNGGVHVSMSTVSPALARRLAERHAERGQAYLAAPVFGKPDAAAAAKLWIAVSGPDTADARLRTRPILDAMSQGVREFGPDAGAANVVKLAGNFLLGAAVEAMAEAFTLAELQGVGREAVYALFTDGLFDCPVYRSYGGMVARQEYQPVGAPPALIRKDFGLVLDAARAVALPMPLAGLVHDRLTSVVARGGADAGGEDWASFAREVSERAGMPRRAD